MKKIALLLIILSVISCSKKSVKPLSEIIQKVWVANIVKENNVIVFSKGSTTNIRLGYSQFKLNLGNGTVSITEFEGTTFTGQWELSADEKKLTLKNLNPQPSGTNGTIEFTINAASDTQLSLTRVTTNAKTGNTSSSYELIPQ